MADSTVSAITRTALPKGYLVFYAVDPSEATAANRSKKITLSSVVNSFVTYNGDIVIYQGDIVNKE